MLFILHLLEEMKDNRIAFDLPETRIYAKCFEDNTGCLDIAQVPKLRPRTKHIAIKYHHFCTSVGPDKGIIISPIDTTTGLPASDISRMASVKGTSPRNGTSSRLASD